MTTIDLTTLTAAEPKQPQSDPAAIIAAEVASQLDVDSFCDDVYSLANWQGITIADSIRTLLAAKTVNKGGFRLGESPRWATAQIMRRCAT